MELRTVFFYSGLVNRTSQHDLLEKFEIYDQSLSGALTLEYYEVGSMSNQSLLFYELTVANYCHLVSFLGFLRCRFKIHIKFNNFFFPVLPFIS